MANDWLSLLDRDPDTVWKNAGKVEKVRVDPIEKRRATLIKGIEQAIAQLKARESNPKRGWYTIKGDAARVTLKAGVKFLPVKGRNHNTVPAERALDFYKGALEAARAGSLDSDLTAAYDGGAAKAVKPKGKRAGWSDERRARQAASIAARKAKKG